MPFALLMKKLMRCMFAKRIASRLFCHIGHNAHLLELYVWFTFQLARNGRLRNMQQLRGLIPGNFRGAGRVCHLTVQMHKKPSCRSKTVWLHAPYNALLLEKRNRRCWLMLIPSILECSANDVLLQSTHLFNHLPIQYPVRHPRMFFHEKEVRL